MTIARIKDIAEKGYELGQQWESSFRKVPALASSQSIWADISGAPGNPPPCYYVGGERTATRMGGSDGNDAYRIASEGIFHGGDVAPAVKYLHRVLIGSQSAGVSPAKFYLCDYLLFYPLVDMDSTDPQPMVNVKALPRYADGSGVEMLLIATNPYLGGAAFTVDYTSADGTAQQSVTEVSNTSTFIGTVVNSGLLSTSGGPFIRRGACCRGVRSVESITFQAPNGGLAALVLVKPLRLLYTHEIGAYAEFDLLQGHAGLPRVVDGAYLNFLACPNGSMAAAPITGTLSVIWS